MVSEAGGNWDRKARGKRYRLKIGSGGGDLGIILFENLLKEAVRKVINNTDGTVIQVCCAFMPDFSI
jgi:hypothetical protein